MKFLSALLLCILALPLARAAQVNVDELLKQVRLVAVAQEGRLDGQVRLGSTTTGVTMFLKQKQIQYHIGSGREKVVYQLTLNARSQRLQVFDSGAWKALPSPWYTRPIGKTGLTYEDLSLRFLYWPKGRHMGEENVQGIACHKVLLRNPDGQGAYHSVYLWIGKENGALMQIMGFDRAGNKLKKFAVGSVMKLDGGYFVKVMEVYPYRRGSDRLGKPTYIEFEKPEKVRKRP